MALALAACAGTGGGLDLPESDVIVGDTGLTVWVADERGERSQGLREVTRLPSDIDGMLFVFPEPTVPTFVMEDTVIPLDLWFFDDTGLLIGSAQMEPCPAEPCPRHPAPGKVMWALETPQGVHRFEPGDLLSTSDSG